MLEEKPANPVDVLETALLVKKTGVDLRETSPLVPVSVGLDMLRHQISIPGTSCAVLVTDIRPFCRRQQMQQRLWLQQVFMGECKLAKALSA